jgi:hypothetical protein
VWCACQLFGWPTLAVTLHLHREATLVSRPICMHAWVRVTTQCAGTTHSCGTTETCSYRLHGRAKHHWIMFVMGVMLDGACKHSIQAFKCVFVVCCCCPLHSPTEGAARPATQRACLCISIFVCCITRCFLGCKEKRRALIALER